MDWESPPERVGAMPSVSWKLGSRSICAHFVLIGEGILKLYFPFFSFLSGGEREVEREVLCE